MLAQVKAYEDKMWQTLKKAAEADNCNTNKQPCQGKLATHRTGGPRKPSANKLVEGAVLAGWAKRCGSVRQGMERHGRQGARALVPVNDRQVPLVVRCLGVIYKQPGGRGYASGDRRHRRLSQWASGSDSSCWLRY